MDLEQLTLSVRTIAGEIADFISEEAARFDLNKVEQKGKNDLVSYVDKESEKKIVEGLKELMPEGGFLTEEKTVEQSAAEYIWVVDPLDGTTNFIHGIPAYSVSIALTKNNEVILGVVHDIPRGESFSAWKNGGAFLNSRKIHVSETSKLSSSLISTGFPIQDFGKKENYLAIVSQLMQDSHGLRRIGSAALDLAYVACGRCEGFFECQLSAWDVAAGSLIVKEAGGVVTDFSGGDNYLFGKEIVAGGTVHPEFLESIKKFWF